MILAYFLATYSSYLQDNQTLQLNIPIWIEACHELTIEYGLSEKQQELIDLLYVGWQLSSPPLSMIPPTSFVSSETVRDFSVSYTPILNYQEGGYAGQYIRLLRYFGMRNKKIRSMIIV